MNEENNRLVLALLAVPTELPIAEAEEELITRLRSIVTVESASKELFRALAESSLPRAKETLELLRPGMSWFYAEGAQEVIHQVEEDAAVAALTSISNDELDAHFVLLALQEAGAPETRLRERALMRVLAQRDPARAAERTHLVRPVNTHDRAFWERLRRRLFLHFQQSEPQHAVRLLDDIADGKPWFLALLASSAAPGKLCVAVLERLLTVAFPARLSREELMELAVLVGQSSRPERVAMLHALIRRVHFPMPQERPDLLQSFLHVARSWAPQEQGLVLEAARKDAICYLLPDDRAEALRQLALWEAR